VLVHLGGHRMQALPAREKESGEQGPQSSGHAG